MPDSLRVDQLLAELQTLSTDEQRALLNRVRDSRSGPPRALIHLRNRGKTPCVVSLGSQPPRTLKSGSALELPITPLPVLRTSEAPTVPDRSGLPLAPKSLFSLCASTGSDGETVLELDLSGWVANAARCGWPFAYHRVGDQAWQASAAAGIELKLAAQHVQEVVVIGLGVDLSELAERFALAFEPALRREPGKEST